MVVRVFAVDSIPAIFAITRDPFIVFTSNIFAILGLRSLYFLLAGVITKFAYLKVGLSFVLISHRTPGRATQDGREQGSPGHGLGHHQRRDLERLVRLNVRPQTLAALAFVPLIEVVWEDGQVDQEERTVVLEHAMSQGVALGSVEHDLLDRWLTHRPENSLLVAWEHYARGLCERLSPSGRDTLKHELLRGVRDAAEASGGFLGIGKISDKEQQILARLESTFFTG